MKYYLIRIMFSLFITAVFTGDIYALQPEGAGPIKFGFTRTQVEKIMKKRETPNNEQVYNGFTVVSYEGINFAGKETHMWNVTYNKNNIVTYIQIIIKTSSLLSPLQQYDNILTDIVAKYGEPFSGFERLAKYDYDVVYSAIIKEKEGIKVTWFFNDNENIRPRNDGSKISKIDKVLELNIKTITELRNTISISLLYQDFLELKNHGLMEKRLKDY